MEKKGQLTLFIILAVLIVAIVAVVFIFKDDLFEDKNKRGIDIVSVVNFVQDCIDKTLNQSIYVVASNGGYSGYSYLNREVSEEGVAYYFFKDNNYMPPKNLVENQIKEHFERKFFLCINDFSNFNNYDIKQGILESYVEIRENEVRLSAKYPLYVRQGKSVASVKKFESTVPSRISVVYDSVNYFIKNHSNRKALCLSCLQMAIKNNIYVDMKSDYNKTVVFIFKDNSSELNTKPLEWVFANMY